MLQIKVLNTHKLQTNQTTQPSRSPMIIKSVRTRPDEHNRRLEGAI